MKHWHIPVFAVVVMVIVAVFFFAKKSNVQWVEVPGTGGIYYDPGSLTRDGDVVFASLKNENAAAKAELKALEINFTAAFYCTRDKVRTLGSTIRTTDGMVVTNTDNHMEDDPNTAELNESHDLLDIKEYPEMAAVYREICAR